MSHRPAWVGHRGRPGAGLAAIVVLFVGSGACTSKRAQEQDCRAILDRIVELELSEMGYADSALLKRKQQESSQRYRQELASCVGKPIPPDALSCAAQASSTEELSHECMK